MSAWHVSNMDFMKTILAIAAVLTLGGICLLLTEPYPLSGVLLTVVGLAPFTLWVRNHVE